MPAVVPLVGGFQAGVSGGGAGGGGAGAGGGAVRAEANNDAGGECIGGGGTSGSGAGGIDDCRKGVSPRSAAVSKCLHGCQQPTQYGFGDLPVEQTVCTSVPVPSSHPAQTANTGTTRWPESITGKAIAP